MSKPDGRIYETADRNLTEAATLHLLNIDPRISEVESVKINAYGHLKIRVAGADDNTWLYENFSAEDFTVKTSEAPESVECPVCFSPEGTPCIGTITYGATVWYVYNHSERHDKACAYTRHPANQNRHYNQATKTWETK